MFHVNFRGCISQYVSIHSIHPSGIEHRHNRHFFSLYQAEPDELWLVALEETSVLRWENGKTHRKHTVGVGVKVEDSGEILATW